MRTILIFLTINILFTANIVEAQKADKVINNETINLCGKFPAGWTQNVNKKWLSGSIAFISNSKEKAVKLTGSSSGLAHFFCCKRVKANDGDKIEFTVKAKGKGIGGVGLYQYPKDGSWRWNGAVYKSFKVSDKLETFKITMTVKGKQPTGQVCLVVWAGKNSTVIVHNIKAKKL